jgi:ubiquinone/menaquinone biosynthesis C-methylase UbiE
MIEKNFLKNDVSVEALIKKFDLRNAPITYSDIDAINYSYRINENIDLRDNPDNLIQQTIKMLPRNFKDKTVMDIGCGEGRWDRFMAQKGARVIGIDSSKKMIEIGKMRSEKFNDSIQLLVADFSDLIDSKEKFDFVFSCYVFNNISNLKKIFQVLYKILKDNGELLIATKLLNFDNSKNEIFKNYFLPIKLKNKYTMYVSGNEFEDYIEISGQEGLELIESDLKESSDCFKNKELNKQGIKIIDAVLKYKKLLIK